MYHLNHETHIGYVKPMTKELISESTNVLCPAPHYYFDLQNEANEVVLISNHTMLTNHPLLQLPEDSTPKEYKKVVESSFKPMGSASMNQVSGYGNVYNLMHAAHSQTRIDTIIRAQLQGRKWSPAQTNIFNTLLDMTCRIAMYLGPY